MTQILANKIVITIFSLVPVKYGIDHTAAMGIFVWGERGMVLLYIRTVCAYVISI